MVNLAFSDEKGALTSAGQQQIAAGLSILTSVVALNNYEKGWRTPPNPDPALDDLKPRRSVGELTALVMTELAEAFEAYRDGLPDLAYESYHDKTIIVETPTITGVDHKAILQKPVGIASELADVIIRVLDWADEYQIPVIQAILEKHAYNQTRPWKHGNKKC